MLTLWTINQLIQTTSPQIELIDIKILWHKLHSAHEKSNKCSDCETTEIIDHENISKLNCWITNQLSTKEELTQFITAVNSFYPALKYTWEISDTSLAFLDIKISIEGNGLVLVFNTNLQIHTVTCCIHPQIHHTSRTPYLCHNFSDFVVYVVTTLIFPKNQRQCASFSINVAILFL